MGAIMSAWVQTFSGVAFDLRAPRVEDVRIDDIAVSLARINRFTGHTIGPDLIGYSVAQHSVHVSRIVEQWGAPPAILREALLHDAGEAYYGDVASPIQRAMRDAYRSMLAELAAEIRFAWADVAKVEAIAGRVLAFAERSDPFRELKRGIDPVVRSALALPPDEHLLVKRADLVALACERVCVMEKCERDWALPEFADRRWLNLVPVSPMTARSWFVDRLREIDQRIAEHP
jgi:5'-deoxynucleotidase YfbR-like HD superfamily hydrolase